jgi:hypothetical protein
MAQVREAVLASKLTLRASSDFFGDLACANVPGKQACVIAWEFIIDQLWWTMIVWAALAALIVCLGAATRLQRWIWKQFISHRLKVSCTD